MLADIIVKVAGMQSENNKYYARPSLAGPDRCIRQMVYWGLEIPRKPFPGRAILIFDDSSWHETLTADWIRKTAYRLHSEQMEVECHAPMTTGHIDGIVTDLLDKDYLLEHKAINHFTFQKYWDNEELPLDYLTQCAIYIDGLQKVNPEIQDGLLLIKNKNTAAYMEYLLFYPNDPEHDILTVEQKTRSTGETKELKIHLPEIVSNACQKFTEVQDYIDRKTLPKRPYDIDDWHCQYCGWGKICWEGYEKEFAELKTDTMLPAEIADLVRYKQETAAHRLEMEKEEKELTQKIKAIMESLNAREGRAGEYICRRTLIKSERIDKSLLTETERVKATVEGMYEKLTISKVKETKQ